MSFAKPGDDEGTGGVVTPSQRIGGVTAPSTKTNECLISSEIWNERMPYHGRCR